MQVQKTRRSNTDRSQATRDLLIAAGRALFVTKGYGDTSTPEIVASAGVTRGALYHHFVDKAALFQAVLVCESERVADDINRATQDCTDAAKALEIGADAYIDSMQVQGRTRLMLVDGPAVLGRDVVDRIDADAAGGTIVIGLSAALGRAADVRMIAQGRLLSAAFERAALDVAAGADPDVYRSELKRMLLEVCRRD